MELSETNNQMLIDQEDVQLAPMEGSTSKDSEMAAQALSPDVQSNASLPNGWTQRDAEMSRFFLKKYSSLKRKWSSAQQDLKLLEETQSKGYPKLRRRREDFKAEADRWIAMVIPQMDALWQKMGKKHGPIVPLSSEHQSRKDRVLIQQTGEEEFHLQIRDERAHSQQTREERIRAKRIARQQSRKQFRVYMANGNEGSDMDRARSNQAFNAKRNQELKRLGHSAAGYRGAGVLKSTSNNSRPSDAGRMKRAESLSHHLGKRAMLRSRGLGDSGIRGAVTDQSVVASLERSFGKMDMSTSSEDAQSKAVVQNTHSPIKNSRNDRPFLTREQATAGLQDVIESGSVEQSATGSVFQSTKGDAMQTE